jgi:ATP-dependent DNA ligase
VKLILLKTNDASGISGPPGSYGVPGFIEPCQPSKMDRPRSGPLWVHEIKHDGYRLIGQREGKRVRLFTHNC